MFEKLLQKLLKDVVGEFVDGIDTKKLNIGIWSGTVEIVNVSLKPRLLAILGLPYRITFSNISRLFITIPWKNLFTAPLVIEIESIQILAQNSSYQLSREEEGKLVLLKIKQFIQKLGRELANNKKPSQEKSGGYLETVYLKMLDNLYLTIRNIHFRFEVSRPLKQEPEATPFSFGVTLQLIELFAVDQKGNRVFIDRTKLTGDKNIIYKKLKLQNFGFYWNHEEKQAVFLSLQTQFPVKQSEERYFKDMLDFKQILNGKSLSKQKLNYLILINAEGLIKEDNRTKASSKLTKYEVSFNIKQIKMVVNEKIIKQAVWFMKQTSGICISNKGAISSESLDKWEGPKNQNFLGLLRKYCINQFWETDNSGKINTPLSSVEQKMLLDCLFENKENLEMIQNKVKEIIVGDIGNKNAVMKSEIINNWQSLEALMSQQKKIEQGQLEVKFNFEMEQLCLFYLDEIKIPIAQLFVKGFKISADQNKQMGLNLQIQIAKLEGLGYDQNPIIRMEHQIESTYQSPKIMKFAKLFSLTYKFKEDVGQQLEIVLGGIGFLYDFKTFRELYKLPQSLISTQSTTNSIPPSPLPGKRISASNPLSEQRGSRKQEPQLSNRIATNQQKTIPSQITITVENISLYILQYTKKTWRLSLSGCQLTNNSSLFPQNILINAMSLSISDFYVCEPFGAKVVLNLRQAVPEICILIEPIRVKINSEVLQYVMKISSSLYTYKKNDAISLSSKYGELYLLEQKEVWKKYDGVIIDKLLYLYEKSDEYSKYQLKVVDASKKVSNKREVIEISVKQNQSKQLDKFMLIVRNQAQLEEWTKNLLELSESNRKALSQPPLRQEQSSSSSPIEKPSKKKSFNLCLMLQQLTLDALQSETDPQPIIRLMVRKAVVQSIAMAGFQEIRSELNLTKKPSLRDKLKQSQEQFKSFKQLRFDSKFSKTSREEKDALLSEKQPFQLKNQRQKFEGRQNWIVEIADMEYWYKKQKRLFFSNESEENKISSDKKSASMTFDIVISHTEIKADISISDRLILHYQPFEILQTISYLNNRIWNVLASVGKKKMANTKIGSELELRSTDNAQKILKIEVKAKKGCEVNLFNMLNYKEGGDNKREQVMKLVCNQLAIGIGAESKRIEITGVKGDWLDLHGMSHTLVSNFDSENKITVQMLSAKLLVKIYELYLPNYQHFLTMRAIEYLLVQFKQIILSPFNFNQYFDVFAETDRKPGIHTRMYRCRDYLENTMTQSQIWERIKNVYQMQVIIQGGYVGLEAAGYATVGLVRVTNSLVESYNGSIKSNVLRDQYIIQLKDFNIWLITTQESEPNAELRNKSEITKKLSKKKQHFQEECNNETRKQDEKEERFYTVLNRFSKQFNECEWEERKKETLVQMIDAEWPLDMSLIVTMFGKYPQYKTIFQNFQTSTINTTIPIKLMLSEIHMNMLASEIEIASKLVNKIVENVYYSDQMSYYYSYDEQVVKAIYRREIQKLNKDQAPFKLSYDANNVILFSVPLQAVVKQDEYIYCPIQFSLAIKHADVNVITPHPQNDSISDATSYKSNSMGIRTVIQNFSILFTQFPLNQTKISLESFDLICSLGENKTKIVELTSIEERQSRDTMFIDSMSNKKQNISKNDLFKSQIPQKFNQSQNVDAQTKQIEKKKSQEKARDLEQKTLINQKEIKQAFSFKMFKKVKRISAKVVQEKKDEETTLANSQIQIMDAIQINFHNIVINYDPTIANLLFRMKRQLGKKTKQEQLLKKQISDQTISEPPSGKKPTEFLCRLHSLLFKTPIPNQSEKLAQKIGKQNLDYCQKMCILIKLAVLTQLPLFLPLRVDVEYFEAYTEQLYEGEPYEQIVNKIIEKMPMSPKEIRKSSRIRNKKKTLLQPTKVFYRQKISQEVVKVKIEKLKQETSEYLMGSKIKSILSISPHQQQNGSSSKVIEQFQKISTTVLLTQMQIDKCFVKISIQDLKKLLNLSKNLNSQITSFIQSKGKASQREENRMVQKAYPQLALNQQKLNLNKTNEKNELKSVYKISFKPLELVIMNDINFSNTPLIYAKLLITDYEFDQFNVELAVNYFNLRINAWEPLVQSNVLLIKLRPHLSVEKLKEDPDDRLSKQISSKNSRRDFCPQKVNSHININISTNFLQSLIPAMQSKRTQILTIRMSETKSVGDEVNCWMLINQLGYDISCESKSFRGNKMSTVINIPNNKSRKLTFLSEMFEGQGFQEVVNQATEEQVAVEGENKKNRWTISIIINNQFRIKEIDIGEIGVKKYCFNYQGHPYWIYGHTYVDISKNVKYIKFYSEVMIINSTNLDLWVRLPAMEQKTQAKVNQNNGDSMKIAPNLEEVLGSKKIDKNRKDRRYSHDYRMNEDTKVVSSQFLQVKTRDMRNKSEYVGSEELDDDSINERLETSFRKAHSNRQNVIKIGANKDASLAFDLDQNFKKLNQNEFCQLISREPLQIEVEDKKKESNTQKIEKFHKFQIQKQRRKMRTIYKILPVGKIINKLPQQINIALKVEEHILYAYSLKQDESQFIYTSFNQLEISVHAKGFQWSVFMPCNLVEIIGLEDFNHNKLNVKMNLFVDDDGIDTVILYPIAVLYNDTDYDLHIRDPECKNYSYSKVLPKKSISLSNYRILVLKPHLAVQTGFTSQQSNYTKVYMNQDEITCKFQLAPIKMNLATQKKLEHIPPTAAQALLINQVSLKTSGSTTTTMRINTKFVTVSHKYYFTNKTNHTILIRKYRGGDLAYRLKSSNFNVRAYQPNSMQSFWLFEQEPTTKDSFFNYQLTIKDSQFEWSGALSITKPGSQHFLLRNRGNFNDVHFMNLVVIKYHQMDKFRIQLKDGHDQIPCIIKNSWNGFLVKLPEFGNLILREGDQIDFSWDQPILKKGIIPILVGSVQQLEMDRAAFSRFEIKTQTSDQNELIKLKRSTQIGEISFSQKQSKVIQIRQYQKVERKTERLAAELQLPIRIALINNSFTPVTHLCDFSSTLCLKVSSISDATIFRINLDSMQIDNQTRYRVYFPVVLSTSIAVTINYYQTIEVQVDVKPVILNIEQDFAKDFYATAMLVSALALEKKGVQSQLNRIQNENQISNRSLISKLSLPAVSINLQVKTKKLSIETTINLDKPATTKYPWQSFPYPIKNIAISLLSHLSISPWALISSFQKGVVSLLTEQESSKGIEGFFGQILAALSNSVNGLVGILVGHDIERVNNFFDGLEQGSNLLLQQVAEIKDCFQPEQCTLSSIITSFGYGIVSILLKPMKGVLQMTLKVSEGIKKTALFSFEDATNTFKQRDAIVFYGQEQKFRAYQANQSHLMVLLLKICGEPLKYFHLLKFFPISNKETNSSEIACIGTEQVILINSKSQKLIWLVNLHEVTKIYIIRSSCIRFSPFQYQIDAIHEDLSDEILALLLKVHKKVFIKT